MIATYVRIIMTMKKLAPDQVTRIQQLWRAGYPAATIGRLFGVERSVITYHCKNIPSLELEDFLKAMLPHTPLDGPPLPNGWSPTWRELIQLVKGAKLTEKQGVED
jgi:hypothetical protein